MSSSSMGGRCKFYISIKDIAIMAMMTALIFVQEQALTFLPNINFTHLFIALAFYILGLPKTLIVVGCYSLLDNIFMGSLNPFYTPAMIISWMLFPILLYFFGKIFKSRRLMPAIVGAGHSLIYSWVFLLISCLIYKTPFVPYLTADIIWELILCLTSFITIFFLLQPILKPLLKTINKE